MDFRRSCELHHFLVFYWWVVLNNTPFSVTSQFSNNVNWMVECIVFDDENRKSKDENRKIVASI